MDLNGLEVCPLESDSDVEEELALMRISFPDERVDELVRRLLANHPGFGRGSFLTARQEGRIVASLCLIPITWSVGGVPLKVAEMGMVATHPDHRKKGFQRILNTEYDKITAAHGYDLSVIEGIPFFYRQFGYEYTIPLDSEATIPIKKLPYSQESHRVYPFDEEYIPAAMELLQASSGRFLVHGIRPKEVWEAQQRTGWQADRRFEGYVIEEDRKTTAYFRVEWKEDRLCLLEASYTSIWAVRAILSSLKRIGSEGGAKMLVSYLNQEDAVTAEIVAAGGEANRPYGWQVKVVDHGRLLEKLLPLLSHRLRKSPYRDLTDTIRINLYRQCIALVIKGGEVKGIEPCDGRRGDDVLVNPVIFPKLLLGVRSVEELILEYPDVIISQQYRDIIDTIFPKGASYIHTLY